MWVDADVYNKTAPLLPIDDAGVALDQHANKRLAPIHKHSSGFTRAGVCDPYMYSLLFFFQAEDRIRCLTVTGVQTCALPISPQDLPENPCGYPISGPGDGLGAAA